MHGAIGAVNELAGTSPGRRYRPTCCRPRQEKCSGNGLGWIKQFIGTLKAVSRCIAPYPGINLLQTLVGSSQIVPQRANAFALASGSSKQPGIEDNRAHSFGYGLGDV